jgi:glycosyltransferase involved in cell wall biosynthesis
VELITLEGDAVRLIDADFQHPLSKLEEMRQLWLAGYDMIYGVIVDRQSEGFLKRVGTRFFYSLTSAGSLVCSYSPKCRRFSMVRSKSGERYSCPDLSEIVL